MDKNRVAEVCRKTCETDIYLNLDIDGTGEYQINTGVPFFDHMLNLMTKHGNFNLEIKAKGDIEVDAHHTVEDIGICLGYALSTALGDKTGIARYGSAIIPMDEALVLVAVDLSNRSYLGFEVKLPSPKVGNFDTELVEEFLRGLVFNSRITLHVKMLSGNNTHHIIEAVFKGLGRAIRQAASFDHAVSGVPSTKGVL